MRHLHAGTITMLAVACWLFAGSASARQFPVSGSVTINGGTPAALPANVTFGDSTYNASNGDLSAGTFNFPVSTATFDNGNGVVTYRFTQTNASTALVGSSGMAMLSVANMSLKVLSASYYTIAIDVGTDCVFGPIRWHHLWGARTTTGLDLMQATFAVPMTQGSCNGHAQQINDALQGNDNSIELLINGNFSLPNAGASDLIFFDGFGL